MKFVGVLVLVALGAVGSVKWLRDDIMAQVEQQAASETPMSLGKGWYLTGVAWEGLGWDGILDSILSKGFFQIYKENAEGNPEARIRFFIGGASVQPRTSTQGIVWRVEGHNIKIQVEGAMAFLPGKDLPDNNHAWEEVWVELERFSLSNGEASWSKDALNPANVLVSIWDRLNKQGHLWSGQQLVGKAWIRFPNSVLFFNLQSLEKDGVCYIATTPEDLSRAATQMGKRLTEAEVELYALYPARLPVLFAIQEYAGRISKTAARRIPELSEHAYRHLLWSYLLTREYGEDFAKLVTDAHEVGNTGNSPQKREADLHNNALARQLYREGVEITQLLEIAKKDPRVRRVPRGHE